MLIMITQLDVGMDSRLSVQQIDDNPVADLKGSVKLREYYRRYREIAAYVGISLADESKPEKAFPPSLVGEVLGIYYDLSNWTWNMDESVSEEIVSVEEEGRISMNEAEVLMGKLHYYSALVPK